MAQPSTNVNEILEKIAKSRKKFSFPVFIPSLNREVNFYQMTTAQQTEFVKSSMAGDSSYSNTMYSLLSIITNNCADPDVHPANFTIIDKLIISMAIRMVSVSPTYRVIVNDVLDDAGNPVKASIDLGAICNKIAKTFRGKSLAETIDDKTTDISVTIGIPTIGTEVMVERDAESKARTESASTDEQTTAKAMGELYLLECLKFIKAVTFKTNDGDETVDLSSMATADRRAIVDALPSSIMEKVAERVNAITEELNSITLLRLKDKDGVEHTYPIRITDPAFFMS